MQATRALNLSFEETLDLSRRGNLIPLCREILADLQTPVSAYLRIAAGRERSFLFESVEGGEALARYSFLGRDPYLVLRARGRRLEIEEEGRRRAEEGDPLQRVHDLAAQMHPVAVPGLPRFTGGAVGYFGYDLIRLRERLPDRLRDDLQLPDLALGFYDTILAFDHLKHRILIIANLRVPRDGGVEALRREYARAADRIEEIERCLEGAVERPGSSGPWPPAPLTSNFERSEFEACVRRAKEHIGAGDIFQVVLSRRQERDLRVPAVSVYRALRTVNPSPYMFLWAMDGLQLVGASPEMLVRVEGERIRMCPIAGTRPRGSTDAEDAAFERELVADPKERAEHLMLLDLARNDLGRVSEYGSVVVRRTMVVERYSHVMHLVSEVEGRLRRGVAPIDAMMAGFPAGTVSGAPKVRAMEIIEEMEPTRRGPYAGAVGYLDFSGNLDSCITIRTLVARSGRAYVQSGCGVVADSVPEREFEETVNKARALWRAVELAEERF
jgi:anthranilate synthase component 1